MKKNNLRTMAGLLLLACLAIVIPAASSFAAPPSAEVAPPIAADASCQMASETGFEVCDDSNARFLSAYLTYGIQNVGYPISNRYQRDGFITQAFQKAIFQWRADTQTVAFKNIFDELSKQGFDERLLNVRQTPNPLPAGWDGDISFAEVIQKRQALLTRPALQAAYFAASDPLTFFGLPTSTVQDMGNHYAIRLQRAVLQEWKENVPWASIGQVTIANGGDIAKEMGALPAFAIGEAPPVAAAPASPTATPAPSISSDTTRKLDPRLELLGITIEEADVAPGQPYWRVVEVFWHNEEEAGGRHHLYVDVKDESGTNIAGIPIRFGWESGEQVLPSSTNFPMYAAGYSYNVSILGLPSDTVRGLGLGTPELRYHTIHVEYFLRFQRTIKQ